MRRIRTEEKLIRYRDGNRLIANSSHFAKRSKQIYYVSETATFLTASAFKFVAFLTQSKIRGAGNFPGFRLLELAIRKLLQICNFVGGE